MWPWHDYAWFWYADYKSNIIKPSNHDHPGGARLWKLIPLRNLKTQIVEWKLLKPIAASRSALIIPREFIAAPIFGQSTSINIYCINLYHISIVDQIPSVDFLDQITSITVYHIFLCVSHVLIREKPRSSSAERRPRPQALHGPPSGSANCWQNLEVATNQPGPKISEFRGFPSIQVPPMDGS